MNCSVKIKATARKELLRIDRKSRIPIIEAIDKLAVSPHAGSALKGEFSGLRRIRVGDYRVIYEVDNNVLTVLVVRIANRKQAYRR